MKYKQGQITTMGVGLTALATVIASAFTAWGTSSKRVSDVERAVSVVEEREDNHYTELKSSLDRIEDKLDRVIEAK